MTDPIEAHSELMRTVNDREVLTRGETLIVAECWNPALVIPDIGVPANGEKRQAAFPRVGPVSAGNPKNIRAPILSEIRSSADVPETCKAVRGVVYFGRAQ